jgi:hypothetical protein
VEYAYNDYAVYTLAKGLGKKNEALATQYLNRSANWKNLWNSETVDLDIKGYRVGKAEICTLLFFSSTMLLVFIDYLITVYNFFLILFEIYV